LAVKQDFEMKPITRRTKLLSLTAALAVALTAGHAFAADDSAGGVAAALKDVTKTLNALIATVSDLGSKVATLTSIVSPPIATPTVLTSGPLSATVAQQANCIVANTGTSTVTVTVSLRDGAGVPIGSPFTFTAGPGSTGLTGNLVAQSSVVYCRFESGQAGQLRGTLMTGGLTSDAR
jgi:hypothetical protein